MINIFTIIIIITKIAISWNTFIQSDRLQKCPASAFASARYFLTQLNIVSHFSSEELCEKIEEEKWENEKTEEEKWEIILSCVRKYLALARALAGHFWSQSLWIKVFHENAIFRDDDDDDDDDDDNIDDNDDHDQEIG